MSRSKYVSVGDTGGLILDSKYDDFVTNAQLESMLGSIENRLVALEQKLFVRLSTEPRPSGSEGDTLLLYDTKQVFIHDGTDWREW